MRQHRVIGRVIDRVGEAGEREHGDEKPERIDEPGERKGEGAKQQPGNQENPRTEPVDQIAGRRLAKRGDDIECGEGEAELDVADAVIGAHEGEQRRQDDDVVMRDEMRGADAGDELRVTCDPRGCGLRRLRHAPLLCAL